MSQLYRYSRNEPLADYIERCIGHCDKTQKDKRHALSELGRLILSALGGELPSTSGISPLYMAMRFSAFNFSLEEMGQLADICIERAKRSPMSAEGYLTEAYYQLLNGQTTKEELLKPMEHILTITTRELKEFDHALHYSQKLAHGTAGHNQLMLLGKVAEYLGFVYDEKGQIVVPDKVRIEDGTGR